MPGQLVELHERVLVEERVDAFPCGLFSAGMLAFGVGGSGVDRLINPAGEVGEPAGGGVGIGRVGGHVGDGIREREE
jgi:hypothetical protein